MASLWGVFPTRVPSPLPGISSSITVFLRFFSYSLPIPLYHIPFSVRITLQRVETRQNDVLLTTSNCPVLIGTLIRTIAHTSPKLRFRYFRSLTPNPFGISSSPFPYVRPLLYLTFSTGRQSSFKKDASHLWVFVHFENDLVVRPSFSLPPAPPVYHNYDISFPLRN